MRWIIPMVGASNLRLGLSIIGAVFLTTLNQSPSDVYSQSSSLRSEGGTQ